MRILLDHNVPRVFRRSLPGHEVRTTRDMGWEDLENGLLLATAAAAGFEVFLSIDKKLEYEQNLRRLPLTIVVLDAVTNAPRGLSSFAPVVLTLLLAPLDRALYWLGRDGSVERIDRPR